MARTVLYLDPDDDRRERSLEHLERYDYGASLRAVPDLDGARAVLAETAVDVIVAPATNVVRELLDRYETDAQVLLFDGLGVHEVRGQPYARVEVEYSHGDDAYTQVYNRLSQLLYMALTGHSFLVPPVPEDERDRLGGVQELDIEALKHAETFHRLSQLAAGLFDVPIAYVGLIDARTEHFVGCFGTGLIERNREDTICAYTVAADDLLVVEDVPADPRFQGKGLEDYGIEWYAGVPVRDRDGRTVGTFCIADQEQHELDPDDEQYLWLFAEQVSELLELRRQLDEVKFVLRSTE